MTDNTDSVAGMYKPHGPRHTCILNEGAITVTASGSVFDPLGTTSKAYTFANPITAGNLVALSVDTACTWAATGGNPVVEKPTNGEAFIYGRVITVGDAMENRPSADAAADTLAERLAGGFYRLAEVEFFGMDQILKAEVYQDGSNAVTVGATASLKHNLTSDYADNDTTEIKLAAAASGGTGLVAMHYVAAGTSGDTTNCLVGLTGPLTCVTGA